MNDSPDMKGYDVVIIGSGLGGLLCGCILGMEGYHVCVLEKNRQTGGCLQTFTRNGSIFDTGMHYIGGLDENGILSRFFNYLGIIKNLNIKKLDKEAYDVIRINSLEVEIPMEEQAFVDSLSVRYPEDKEGLIQYVKKIHEITDNINPFASSNQMQEKYIDYYSTSFSEFLDETFTSSELRNILAGMSPVYAGVRNKTPLYIPMMIHGSFFHGAYRMVDGGSQLADLLVEMIRKNGGDVITEMPVTKINLKNSLVASVDVGHDGKIYGRHFISGIHPVELLKLTEPDAFKPAYRERLYNLEESIGMFSLYLSSRHHGFPYENRNYYCYQSEDPLCMGDYHEEDWPKGFMVHFSPVSGFRDRTNAIIVNTYMRWNELNPWHQTTTGNRGPAYESFKQARGEKLLEILADHFPQISSNVTSWYTSTPLTYRDYTGTRNGSAYGIQRDYKNPFRTMILPRTHIRNLLLTGQNINTHGIIGVTIGAYLTCSEMLGKDYLSKKISHA